ncbi:MAG: alpha/beta hydrolase family protein [Firmicutes bacterium]|nr:alpha/beta hydrolase family protein [Bacillota bacterium]
MALISCNFFSEVLGLSTSMTVILPQQTSGQIGLANVAKAERHPTLWLLHGMSDDDTIWLRRTSIERYVAALGLAVVMPQVHRSFYTDMAYGLRYWTFLSEELPRLARAFFPLSDAREDNFVAGLSMGGYGAFKWALSKPEQFAAAASLSGALDRARQVSNPSRDFILAFGDEPVAGTDNDLFELLSRCDQGSTEKPMLYQCCGTEDFLYEGNQRFRSAASQSSLDYTYEEGPGTHEWGYWDAKIQDVLAWLPLQRNHSQK